MTPLVIAEAHCSVEFHPDWPLSEAPGAVSQALGDSGGSVFLHYGPSSTLDIYVGRWRERGGAQLTADDRIVTGDGLTGRSMTLALDEEVTSRLGDERRITPARTLVCNGFTIESVPVLLGYLVPAATDPRVVEAAERIVGSLTVVR